MWRNVMSDESVLKKTENWIWIKFYCNTATSFISILSMTAFPLQQQGSAGATKTNCRTLGPQSLKYLLLGPWQEKVANSHSGLVTSLRGTKSFFSFVCLDVPKNYYKAIKIIKLK